MSGRAVVTLAFGRGFMDPERLTPHDLTRRTVLLRGTVQGVGFRPFVHGPATEPGLSGSVRDDSGGVVIEVQGPSKRVERFLAGLRADLAIAAATRGE
jgi:hydrogenase maturation protein HypF